MTMDRNAALTLTARIKSTWTEQPWPNNRIELWVDALEQLDEGAAGTTWARLRDTEERCPSVATFVATCRNLRTTPPEQYADCRICENHGWEYLLEDDDQGIERVLGVQPCRCPRGRRYEDAHRNAIDHNDAELERLGLTRRTTNQHRGAA